MAHLPEAVHRLFAQQHGMAATTQLRSFMSTDQIHRVEEGGSIVGFLRGVYRSPSWPIDELSRCAAVCLGRPYAAIAGPTAGRIYGFRRLPPDRRMHVLTPPARKPVDATWVAAYRTAAIRDRGHRAPTRRPPDHESRPDRARPRPLRTTGRPAVDHRADHARRPPHRRGDDGGRGRLHVAAAAMDHHVPGSVHAPGGWRTGRVAPRGRIGAALLAAGIVGVGTPASDRSPRVRSGAVRPRRAVASLGDRGRCTSGPPRKRSGITSDRRRDRRRRGGRLVDVAHLCDDIRAAVRRHHRRPRSGARATSLPSRSHAAPKRCRCGARLTRHRHRSELGQVGDVDVGLD